MMFRKPSWPKVNDPLDDPEQFLHDMSVAKWRLLGLYGLYLAIVILSFGLLHVVSGTPLIHSGSLGEILALFAIAWLPLVQPLIVIGLCRQKIAIKRIVEEAFRDGMRQVLQDTSTNRP